ncbi:aldehyde dehydrogenase family protein [Actinoallomurus rhizosphaericola]|uniref:aldehyde dehydrogenase family protein n=1 Tax=Actinoallomurus rhizosphaericola TaxID=2952536 RepID=UPI002093645C|nr:aldehyde dehydrogenase family protein [Actinoallomurus rhizosphaericola]MCO5995370.1 aldehyde dehydrogenase family protein [Actinoallomurus rhizosphaericola]
MTPRPGLLDRIGGVAVRGRIEKARGPSRVLYDPSYGTPIAEFAEASADEVAAAVAEAVRAFPAWAGCHPRDRQDVLLALADQVDRATDELTELEALNSGKPLAQARGEMTFAVRTLRYFAGTPMRPTGELNPSAGGTLAYTDRTPLGVCAAIAPSNYPLLLSVWKLAAALAYGNAVILKPAEETPLSALRFAELAHDAGLPPGVLAVVTGGPETGRLLCRHPDVAAVSFTGSTAAGRDVAALCAEGIKPVSLELGGVSPFVVLADADLDAAAAALVEGFTGNTGQMCVAAGRLIVESPVREAFVERVARAAAARRIGPAFDPGTELGPLVSAEARDHWTRQVDRALTAGARVVEPRGAEPSGGGYYVAPVVLDGVRPDMPIAREEVFGPVLPVIDAPSADEALRLAADTRFGLAASLWTRDLHQAHRAAGALRAGMVWINTYGDTEEHISVGGIGLSGYGRELGEHAREQYTATRAVFMAHG